MDNDIKPNPETSLDKCEKHAYPSSLAFLGFLIIQNEFNLLLRQVNNHDIILFCITWRAWGSFWNELRTYIFEVITQFCCIDDVDMEGFIRFLSFI